MDNKPMEKMLKLQAIFAAAEKAKPKGDYSLYRMYRENIEDLNLDPEGYQSCVRKLAEILKV